MATEQNPDMTVPGELRWRVHMLTENWWRSILLISIIVLVLVGVWQWTHTPILVIFGIIMLSGSLGAYFFPVDYRLSSDGIEIFFIGVRTFRSWNEYRNFYPHNDGVHLSTFRRLNWLDSFRGNFIRFTKDNRESVISFLDVYIKRDDCGTEKEKPEG